MSLTIKRPSPRVEAIGGNETYEGGEKRIVANVPARVHRLVRMRCLERGTLMRDYIVELLARDGIE